MSAASILNKRDILPAPVPIARFEMQLPAKPGRGAALQLRVSVPQISGTLPVILFSHGNGSSRIGYGPLVDFWSAHGFVVIQPTHLDSRILALAPDDPRRPSIWRFRAQDIISVLDQLDAVEQLFPPPGNILDRERIAAAGHSWGGQTVGMLLGARLPNPETGSTVNFLDARIKAGILLAAPGRGGSDLEPETAKRFPFLQPSFSEMTTPALVVYGDSDFSHMTPRGPDWRADPYFMSPAPKCLLVLKGGEHSLGGIVDYHSTETTDECPERVLTLQHLTWAYLQTALYGNSAWFRLRTTLASKGEHLADIECK
jgi:predicted dienelactone hydrolase